MIKNTTFNGIIQSFKRSHFSKTIFIIFYSWCKTNAEQYDSLSMQCVHVSQHGMIFISYSKIKSCSCCVSLWKENIPHDTPPTQQKVRFNKKKNNKYYLTVWYSFVNLEGQLFYWVCKHNSWIILFSFLRPWKISSALLTSVCFIEYLFWLIFRYM